MAFRYIRDDLRRQITVVMSELVTEADMLAIIDRQAGEGTWRYRLLFDERNASPSVTPEGLRRVFERVGHQSAIHGKRGRVAIVTKAGPISIARDWAPFGDRQPHQVDPFTDLEVAQRWLDASETDDRR